MVGTIFVSKLPADGPPVLSDTKEQIVEHPQPQSLAIDRHRRHAVNAAEQADGELVAAVPRIQIRSEDERPAVRDRKPLIGTHPEFPALSIFNGMGSKGVLMAPFLAGQFADALTGKGTLWPEVSIARYQQFYLKGN